MTDTYFVTGTDTDIGKTLAAKALLQAVNALGMRTAGYKPVAAGCEQTSEGLRNGDALTLQRAGSVALDYASVNPYALTRPLSPHLAAPMDNVNIDAAVLTQGLRQLQASADVVVVEGAGGWLVPLSDTQNLNQWVIEHRLPVILVVGIRLGCLNHALLSKRVIEADGLRLAGWIANHVDPNAACQQENLAYLTRHLGTPLLGRIPHLQETGGDVGHYLDLSALTLQGRQPPGSL
ncbi:ATP-dependent dethiobiotin synthetase BioD [Ferrimonas sediminicola]|uniref:ATP-dependent dethiobiotin synthetase BioD n=1 Tax=Ferrimonas sediminicola TaxID=2569538 RepID=A0A4U1B923_9GAMM|nr:dethiobiotin synthase [Ferrimonas sediminicola]TKB46810.1 ATP-dependent dethiobiotin synthetase BioD [Ferrimonas sediminicola]